MSTYTMKIYHLNDNKSMYLITRWYNFFWNTWHISNDINFSEIPCTSQMISIFLKHSAHLKWYQYFWNTLPNSNDINISETLCPSQMISIFLKHSAHLKWYQYFWNSLHISNDINIFEIPCLNKQPTYPLIYLYTLMLTNIPIYLFNLR